MGSLLAACLFNWQVASKELEMSVRSVAASLTRRALVTKSYLVDPASSHMLVSKIKPCMSKHKPSHGKAANGSLGHPWFLRSYNPYLDNCGNSRANTCIQSPTREGKRAFIRSKLIGCYGSRSRPGVGPHRWWLWITSSWSHSLELATDLSSVCPINFRWYVTCLPWS